MKLIKYKNLPKKNKMMIIGAIASWGVILIGSGSTMMVMAKPIVKDVIKTIEVTQKRVSTNTSNEIILKELTINVNDQLSYNINDYLENPDLINTEVLNKLELDISDVNINQAGTYTYTITYDKMIYNGQIIVNGSEETQLASLTLKSLSLPINSVLSTELETYITEVLTPEIKALIYLDITKVNSAKTGMYQYTVTYNNRLYTGNIEIYEPNLPATPEVETETPVVPETPVEPDVPTTPETTDPVVTP